MTETPASHGPSRGFPTGPEEGSSGHPSLDRWVAYHERSLPEDAASSLQDHLVDCAQCLGLLQDLENLAAARPPQADRAADLEVASFHQAVRQRIRLDRWRALASAAAALVVVAAGAVIWMALGLRRGGERPPDIVAGFPVFELSLPSQRRAAQVPEIDLSTEVGFVVVLIHPQDPEIRSRYRVELARPEGEAIWSRDVAPDAGGTLNLSIPSGLLEPGEHVLRLFPAGGRPRESLEAIPFRIRPRG